MLCGASGEDVQGIVVLDGSIRKGRVYQLEGGCCGGEDCVADRMVPIVGVTKLFLAKGQVGCWRVKLLFPERGHLHLFLMYK